MSSTLSAADRRLQYSVSAPVTKATRAQVWTGLLDKIRHPEKYVGARDVSCEEGDGFVKRVMTIGPPQAPMQIKEKITWNEADGRVTFTMIDDPTKTGYVDNLIIDEGGKLTLKFIFDWQFSEQTPDETVQRFKTMITQAGDSAVKKTVEVIEGTTN